MRDFYDDAILDADEYVREIVDLVQQRGLFDDTLLVIYSDHGAGFQTNVPLPLMIRLPGGVRSGRLGVTAQMIDIAPTLLDVLGIRAPRWMEGISLLGEVRGKGIEGSRAVWRRGLGAARFRPHVGPTNHGNKEGTTPRRRRSPAVSTSRTS